MDIRAGFIGETEEEIYQEAKGELERINEMFLDPAYDLTVETEEKLQHRAEALEVLIYDYGKA